MSGTDTNTGNAGGNRIYGDDSLEGTRKKHILHFTVFLAHRSLHQMEVPTRVTSVVNKQIYSSRTHFRGEKSGLSSTK